MKKISTETELCQNLLVLTNYVCTILHLYQQYEVYAVAFNFNNNSIQLFNSWLYRNLEYLGVLACYKWISGFYEDLLYLFCSFPLTSGTANANTFFPSHFLKTIWFLEISDHSSCSTVVYREACYIWKRGMCGIARGLIMSLERQFMRYLRDKYILGAQPSSRYICNCIFLYASWYIEGRSSTGTW